MNPNDPRRLTIDDLGQTVMPFGKWKGKRFDDIDIEYLLWLERENVFKTEDHRDRLKAYMEHPRTMKEIEKHHEAPKSYRSQRTWKYRPPG